MSVGLELLLSTLCINATFCPEVFQENLSFENVSMADLVETPEHSKQRNLALLKKELNGKHLRIGTIENFPLSYTEMVNGTRVGKGVAFEFVNILKEKLNFTYKIRVPQRNWEGGYGRLEKSLLGMLANNSIDLAAAFLPILTEARSIVRYSVALDEGVWAMMMKRPRESAAGSGLLAPFDENVWYLILVAVVAYGPCITILTWLRHFLTGDEEAPPIGIASSFWFVYGSFIKQGTTMEPESKINPHRLLARATYPGIHCSNNALFAPPQPNICGGRTSFHAYSTPRIQHGYHSTQPAGLVRASGRITVHSAIDLSTRQKRKRPCRMVAS